MQDFKERWLHLNTVIKLLDNVYTIVMCVLFKNHIK